MPVPTTIADLSTTAASNYPQGSDSPSTLDDVQRAHGSFIAQLRDGAHVPSASAKTTAVDADLFPINDSAASNLIKKLTFANLKSSLKTYFDTVYGAIGAYAAAGANSDITSLSGVRTIQPIGATVAANALTISASSLSLDFRSTTLGSGSITNVLGTPSNLVIPSGATLGTVNGIQSRIVVLAINNAGTIELAVVNMSGTIDLSETGLINTTAISAGSTSATVVYSTSARTGVAYRVIGYIESTQATAGTWATAPSTIQGSGGQALVAMSSAGYGQNWQGVVRTSGTTYYNTTGKPIQVFANFTSSAANPTFTIVVNNNTIISAGVSNQASAGYQTTFTFTVPPNQYYYITVVNATFNVCELR